MTNTRNLFIGIFGALIVLIMGGCASSGTRTTQSIEAPAVFNLARVRGEASAYVDEILAPIVDRGFRKGATNDPKALYVEIQFDPNLFHTAFTVLIKQYGTTLVKAEASNSGWGTGIARGYALSKLALEVSNQIDSQLSLMRVVASPDIKPTDQYQATSSQAPSGNTTSIQEPIMQSLGTLGAPRIALLIGNATYTTSPLANPVNDVRGMATALR